MKQMEKLARPSRRDRRSLASFLRNSRGVTAIEFAFLFPVFMLLIGGLLENGLVYFRYSQLQNVTETASRQLRLYKTGTMGAVEFRDTYLCNASRGPGTLGSMFDCNQIKVFGFGQSIWDASSTGVVNNRTILSNWNFTAAGSMGGVRQPDEMGLLYVYYLGTPVFPLLKDIFLRHLAFNGSNYMLIGRAAYRVEPTS